MQRYVVGVAAVVLGSVVVGVTGLPHATAAPSTTTSTVTLPLFGVPLTLDITTGPGGNISDVAVEPADNTVATHLKPHKVVFKSANPADPTADPARIVIKSKHGGQSVSARAGSLGDVSGPGSWSGDLFGDGSVSTVDFTIGAAADGTPTISIDSTSGASAVVGELKVWSGEGHDDDGTSAAARISVKFTNTGGDQSRSVTVAVKVHTGEEHSGAKLSVTVGRLKGVALEAAAVAGPHTWNGTLCDGTPVSVAYTVAEDGAVSDVTATPDTAKVRTHGGKIIVGFSRHEAVFISVREHDGMIKISAMPLLKCDTGQPTVNGVDVTLPVPDDDESDGHDGDDHGDWSFGGGHGGSGFGGGD